MIDKDITNRLELPHILYASIIKRILIDTKTNNFMMRFNITHPAVVHIIGDVLWNFVKGIFHEILIHYDVSGISLPIILVIRNDNEKGQHKSFYTSRNASKEITQNLYNKMIMPKCEMRIFKEDFENTFKSDSWNDFKQFILNPKYIISPFIISTNFITFTDSIDELKKLHNHFCVKTSIRLSKPFQHFDGSWFEDSWFKWRYFACVIREFCMVSDLFRESKKNIT